MRSFERVCVRMCTLAMTTMGKSQATGEIGTIDNYGDRLMNWISEHDLFEAPLRRSVEL